jgi:hypothetical protein
MYIAKFYTIAYRVHNNWKNVRVFWNDTECLDEWVDVGYTNSK